MYPAKRGSPPDFLMTALFLSDFDNDHSAKALPLATFTGKGSSSSSQDSKFPNWIIIFQRKIKNIMISIY